MSLTIANDDRAISPNGDTSVVPARAFHVTVLFTLLVLAMAGPFLTVNPDQNGTLNSDGNPIRQISYICLFAVAAWNFRSTRASALLVVPFGIVLVLAWSWLSLSWAIAPAIAFRRLILTSVIIWTTFLAVRQARYEDALVNIRYAMVFGLIANYAAVIAWPQFGIHHVLEKGGDPDLIGTWKGVMLQKNFAGAVCALTIIFHFFDGARMRTVPRLLVMGAAAFFLLRTHSKTSMGLMGLSLAAGCAFLAYRPRYRVFMFVGIGLGVIFALMYVTTHFDALVAPFSSQEAFTGRGSIWPVTFHYWRDHWLGSGYGSFWVIGDDSPVFRYGKGWVTDLGNGHNGYLDLLAEIGTPGFLLTISAFIFLPLFRLLGSTTVVPQRGALLVASLVFCAGHNVTESSLLDRDMIVQVFLTFTIAMIYEATQRIPDLQGNPSPAAAPGPFRRRTTPAKRHLVSAEPRYQIPTPG